MSNGAADGGAAAAPARSRALVPIVVGLIVVADQLTKSWMVSRHSDSPVPLIGDTVELRLARNPGGAFSSFTNATLVLALLAIGLTVWLVRTVRRTRDLPTVIALALVLGGALGNLADRVFRSPGVLRGHVVDFVRVGSFPSFNVADSAITVGAILLVLLSFRSPPSDPVPDSAPDATPGTAPDATHG